MCAATFVLSWFDRPAPPDLSLLEGVTWFICRFAYAPATHQLAPLARAPDGSRQPAIAIPEFTPEPEAKVC